MGFNKLLKNKYKNILFTTPSHSQKYCIFSKFRHFYKYDVSETDTYTPDLMLVEAQKYASEVYGTVSTLFLTNGSSSGIITSVLAVASPGDYVLIWRGAHRCHNNAVLLSGATPIYYDLPIDAELGISKGVSPDVIENAFKANNNIKAVIITSPSYEGFVSDIKSIKAICEKYGAYLIVDEAHGALYPFSEELPETAIHYADFVVQSLHKTAGGLNPTALLHSNCDIDIQFALDKITTTSPSYPLLMTIEKNIQYLNSNKGKKKISELISNIKKMRSKCKNVEFYGDDITKILIKRDGLTGCQLSKKLFDDFHIEDEKTNEKSTMLLCGIGTNKGKLDKLALALKRI